MTLEMKAAIIEKFTRFGQGRDGFLDRSKLASVLQKSLQLDTAEVENLIEAAGQGIQAPDGRVRYEDFLMWLMDGPVAPGAVAPPAGAGIPEDQIQELEDIADSLTSIANTLDVSDHAVSTALQRHAAHLMDICLSAVEPDDDRSVGHVSDHEDAGKIFHPEDHDPLMKLMEHHAKPHVLTAEQLGFREQAAEEVTRTGQPGEFVDDVKEVHVTEMSDKLAISYWRFCSGLRLYKSATVTKALRLICSAPVPGLGKTSYLDVFQTLTQTGEWENHIYLFGGLVRDILRRTVGNDIDIGFSAPAAELEATCQSAGYNCSLDGDYILIGDEEGDEYLEGMVISFNGIQPPEHADFSMNTLFYDFKNDVIIDKTGIGMPAVMANRCDLPCPRDRWKSWIDINGVRVCFRYYKFLLRGYDHTEHEMLYVTETLLDCWAREEQHTIDVGRIALGNLVECKSEEKIEKLRQLVFQTFELAQRPRPKAKPGAASRRQSMHANFAPGASTSDLLVGGMGKSSFFSAGSWWQKGWVPMLKLSA